jgi:hypothetical protein
MNAAPSWWRRLAMKLAQHASRVFPSADPWADAMRHELDYIADDVAALHWAFGGLLASYRARLAQLRCFSARASFRYVGTIGVSLLVVGLVLEGHASGQTKPPQPTFDETACDLPGVSAEIRPRLRRGCRSSAGR